MSSPSSQPTQRVDSSFLEQLRSYLNGDVSRDVESMATSTPQVTHLKELFSKDCELLHRCVCVCVVNGGMSVRSDM